MVYIRLLAHGLRKGDEYPAYTPHGVILFCSLAVLDPRVGHTIDISVCHIMDSWTYFLHLSLTSVSLADSSTGSPVYILMLSIQAVRGLSRLRAPSIVPCIDGVLQFLLYSRFVKNRCDITVATSCWPIIIVCLISCSSGLHVLGSDILRTTRLTFIFIHVQYRRPPHNASLVSLYDFLPLMRSSSSQYPAS